MGITQQIGASSLIKAGVIDNTANRPASPYEGQVIFQKDTDQLLVWNGTAWVIPNSPAQNPMGLELVSSGSFTSITSASPLVLSDVLTTNYPHYKIIMSWTQATAAGWLNMNLRNSGGVISTSTYDNQRLEMYGTSSAVDGALNAAAWTTLAYNYNLGYQSFFNADITFATVAQPTQINGTGTTKRTGGGGSYIYTQSIANMENTATVATGLNIYPGGGAMTGSYKLYGYRNS